MDRGFSCHDLFLTAAPTSAHEKSCVPSDTHPDDLGHLMQAAPIPFRRTRGVRSAFSVVFKTLEAIHASLL